MNDKITELFGLINESNDFGGVFSDEDEFRSFLSDDTKVGEFFNLLNESSDFSGVFANIDEFKNTFLQKKKDPSSIYMESLAKGTPTTEALRDFWKAQEESAKPSSQVQPPFLSKQPTKREDTLAEKQDVSSVLRAQSKLPEYFKTEQERIYSETEQSVRDELSSMGDKYKAKIEADPTKKEALQKEYEEEANKIITLRSEGLPSAIDALYKKGKDYQYLDPTDVKELAAQAKEIVSKPIDFIQKQSQLEALQSSVLSQVGSLSPEDIDVVKREINDVIAQSSLLDENGRPSVYGWKREVLSKRGSVQRGITELLAKDPNLANVYTDYKVRSSEDGKKILALENANKLFESVLKLPDDGGGFWEGIKSQGKSALTMGMSDLFQALDVKGLLDKQRKGESVSAEEQSLIDAYGIMEVAQNADEFSKSYQTGRNIGGSIGWMGQFALTGGIGGVGEKIATKALGNALKKKLTDSVIKDLVKTGVRGAVKGLGGAVARTPVLVGGYTEAISRMSGRPSVDEQGLWRVDPASVEPVREAVLKGAYSNFANAFGETAGGWFAGSKFNKVIGKKIGLTKIPKVTQKVLNSVGMQPFGELSEELLTTLMETPVMGDQTLKEAFSWENIWDTAVTTGIISGFFAGMSAPSIISENVRRGRAADMIKIFGKDNISALRTAIEKNDKAAFADAIQKSFEGKTEDDLGMTTEKAQRELTRYSNYLAQVKGQDTAQEAIKEGVSGETGVDINKVEEEIKPKTETKEVVEDAGREEKENISQPEEVVPEQVPEGETVDGIRTDGETGLETGEELTPDVIRAKKIEKTVSDEVIDVSRLKDDRQLKHTKGVYIDKDNKIYKSNQRTDGELTQEHIVLQENQDLKTIPAVSDIVNTTEGSAFEIENISFLEEGEDIISLDEYNQIVSDAIKLEERGVTLDEAPDIGKTRNGQVKLSDFSMARKVREGEKSEAVESISNKAADFLSVNDRNIVKHEKEILRKAKIQSFTSKGGDIKTRGFLYALKYRPFSIGTYPKRGFITLQSEGSGKQDGHYGIMEYSQPLSQKEVDKYELEYKGRSENDFVQKTQDFTGGNVVLKDYLNNWAENTLKVKDRLIEEIKTDYDMVLTKLKNLGLIKTDCVG